MGLPKPNTSTVIPNECIYSVNLFINLSDHLPVSADFELVLTDSVALKSDYPPAGINWRNIDEMTKQQYANMMKEGLDSINVPFYSLLHGNHICNCSEHLIAIEKYFSDITTAIYNAQVCLPRSRPGTAKSFWNSELTELKNASYDAFNLWRDTGKPSSGVIFVMKNKPITVTNMLLKKRKRCLTKILATKFISTWLKAIATIFGDHGKTYMARRTVARQV